MIHDFCTYFDKNYLVRGLALYQSLKKHCPNFHLWILCMDKESYNVLFRMNLLEVKLIALEDFERGDKALGEAKNNRSLIEYYFTCTPSLPLYIFNNSLEVNLVTYIDADICFFSNVTPICDEIGEHSIAIIEHRFSPYLKGGLISGIYNVGWVTFRRDKYALECLNWWRDRCNEWCYDRIEINRFADQKYLDDWPARFKNVVVLQHKGANAAPWNLANYKISVSRGTVLLDTEPLIFFHFHNLMQLTRWIYDTRLDTCQLALRGIIARAIYRPYLKTIQKVREELAQLNVSAELKSIRCQPAKFIPKTVYDTTRGHLYVVRRITFSRSCMIV